VCVLFKAQQSKNFSKHDSPLCTELETTCKRHHFKKFLIIFAKSLSKQFYKSFQENSTIYMEDSSRKSTTLIEGGKMNTVFCAILNNNI